MPMEAIINDQNQAQYKKKKKPVFYHDMYSQNYVHTKILSLIDLNLQCQGIWLQNIRFRFVTGFNGSQLAKMKKYIPYMSLP